MKPPQLIGAICTAVSGFLSRVSSRPLQYPRIVQMRGIVILVLGLLAPVYALQAAGFTGVYTGTFSGGFDNGEFAMLVRPDNSASLVFYDLFDEEGGVTNLTVDSNGNFSFPSPNGAPDTVTGQISGNNVSGNICCIEPGVFSGTRSSDSGPYQNAGGIYTGDVTGSGVEDGTAVTYDGQIHIILDAPGNAMIFVEVDVFVGAVLVDVGGTGGIVSALANGTISGTLLDGVMLNGTVDLQNLDTMGNWSFADGSSTGSGTWTAPRTEALPLDPLGTSSVLLRRTTDLRWFSYSLGLDNTNTIATITEKGFVGLTRSPAYQTVSRSDFDGDGEPDLLLRDMTGAENGRWVLATLIGKTVSSEGFADLTRNANWQLVSTDDFDGDDKADVLLRNTVDGRWLLYLMNSQTVKNQSVLTMSTDLTDTVAGTGDFNGNGRSDVLLRRADGTWLMYSLDGLIEPVESMPAMTDNLAFSVQALADFDGNDNTDVLLRRADGRWFVYLRDGANIISSGPPAMSENTDFSLVSHADFNADGNADALLRRADGNWFVYVLDGFSILNEGALPMTGNTDFQIVSTDDFNADGKADALLRRTDGRWVLYGLDADGPTILGQDVPDMSKNEAWVPQRD